ncbi:MAG: cobalamin B12-binding domain-containing protein [Deltaproteobacteria bacterium]|nr:cobalamin B12-binding domain-containing protein [Deltaproteobacteria bacterium]
MRRVLLVSANRDHFPEPIFPLGAAYVASALSKGGAQVRIVEAGFSPFPLRFLRREVAAFRPGAVGLSLRNLDNAAYPRTRCYLPWHVTVMGALRRATDAPVFLGGPAFSIEPEGVLALLRADGGVAGDGEEGIASSEGVIAPGESLLGPRFYFAGGDPAWLLRRVYEAASMRRHWFLPGARDWSSHIGPPLLRLFHRTGGPMWRIFRAPR